MASTAVTETTGGSDPTGIRSTYKKDGDDYIVTGRKCFITNSHIADTITVLAKDEENPKAFSTFIMEKGMEGFRATHEENKVGMKGCNTGELLDFAKGLGCQTSGLEYSGDSCEVIREKGHDAYQSFAEIDQQYEFITAFDLVEHLFDVFLIGLVYKTNVSKISFLLGTLFSKDMAFESMLSFYFTSTS